MQPKDLNPIQFHFIPNTHWDREWLYDFQETRMFLVEFMDKLLDIFDNNPEYKSYLLDGQTIPIEDYLEIRPENRDKLISYIKENKLFIGPWYTLPEEHLVNGESLVRNLMIGHRLAETYGGVMKIGYSPFSYGQASQMPQIYLGFGIDTILFYHGVTPEEAPAEFIFEGADGSRLLASRMGSNARYNFFFAVYRPTVFGKKTLERNYFWEEKGLPFHLADEKHFQDHHILVDPVKEIDKSNLTESLEEMKKEELAHNTSEHIACMQGMDSTQPDIYELKTMQVAGKLLKNDQIFFSSLPAFVNALKKSVDWDNLTVLKGERRTPRKLGTRYHLYSDVTSARVRMKRKNAMVEQLLQRQAEPFATMAYLLGDEYPAEYLDHAWKYLLKGHPHDSIAGTGVDQIEKDMHHRLDQSANISTGVLRRALQGIQKRINNSDLESNEVAFTVFNPHFSKLNATVTAVIDLPIDKGEENYEIYDGNSGERIDFQERKRYEHPAIVRHLGDATMEMKALRVHLHLGLNNIPAFGYKSFIFKRSNDFSWPEGSLVTAERTLENNYIKVVIKSNGTLDLLDKSTKKVFTGLHYFQDNGEAGHAWRHVPPAKDRVITTLSSKPDIELIESGPLFSSYSIAYKMQIPRKLDEGKGNYIRRLDADGDDAGRSEQTAEVAIKSEICLARDSKGVTIKTTVNNTCEDHRLRVMFPTHINARNSAAEEPFDVVERPIDRGPESPWRNTWNPTHPQQRFVDVSDGQVGLAILNDGLKEYEVTDNHSRTIALTLLRAFEVALTTVAWRWERHPEMKGSQSLGMHEYRYMIYPHEGDWEKGKVMTEADRLNVSLIPVQAGPYQGTLPKSMSFIEMQPSNLKISAIKRAEKSDQIIVRIYNPTSEIVEGKLTMFKKPIKVRLLNLNEEEVEDNELVLSDYHINLQAKPRKIVTIAIEF
jgi:alpha-mannosidase